VKLKSNQFWSPITKERTFKALGTTTVMMYSITLCRILYSFKDYDRLLGDTSLLYNPNLLEWISWEEYKVTHQCHKKWRHNGKHYTNTSVCIIALSTVREWWPSRRQRCSKADICKLHTRGRDNRHCKRTSIVCKVQQFILHAISHLFSLCS